MTVANSVSREVSDRERTITIIGIMLAFLLSAMDQTIVATAMPRITQDLGDFYLYAWVTTGYMLSSTVTVLICGKLNDLFGPKPVLLCSVLLFMIASMLCGTSGLLGPFLGGGMMQLIMFRVVQGIGGAGLMTGAYTVVGALYEPRERAKMVGWFGGVFTVASVVGPLIGGVLADLKTLHIGPIAIAGWRWVFYVNLPIALLSLLLVSTRMPDLPRRSPGRIDWKGALLIVTAVVPGLLALSGAGRAESYWTLAGLIGLSLVSLLLLVRVETAASQPILPFTLFRNRTFLTVNLAVLVLAMPFMGSLIFLPLYAQLEQGVPASLSGLALLSVMVGLTLSSVVSAQIVARVGAYKAVMLAGSAI